MKYILQLTDMVSTLKKLSVHYLRAKTLKIYMKKSIMSIAIYCNYKMFNTFCKICKSKVCLWWNFLKFRYVIFRCAKHLGKIQQYISYGHKKHCNTCSPSLYSWWHPGLTSSNMASRHMTSPPNIQYQNSIHRRQTWIFEMLWLQVQSISQGSCPPWTKMCIMY